MNTRSETAAEGMHKSYDEITKLLKITAREDLMSVAEKIKRMLISSINTAKNNKR